MMKYLCETEEHCNFQRVLLRCTAQLSFDKFVNFEHYCLFSIGKNVFIFYVPVRDNDYVDSFLEKR
jgi:hypothetical protein